MYYKIILNNEIIDIVETPFTKYYYSTFLPGFVRCKNEEPEAYLCNRTNTIYYVKGWKTPPQDILDTMDTISLEEISEEEYYDLKQRLDDERAPVDASLFTPVEVIEPVIEIEAPTPPVIKTSAELLKDEIDSLKQQNEELRQMVMALLNK